MPFKIAIASGKGGTGKTTVSVNLYEKISKSITEKVQLIDCDVEEPNDLLFFHDYEKYNEEIVYRDIPKIDQSICTKCLKCVEYCAFNAIVILPMVNFAEVNSSLCHSCGACSFICSEDAIEQQKEAIGSITRINTKFGAGLLEGRLKIGSAMQTMMINKTKQLADPDNKILLFDAPPGTSCPFVETVSDVDYVILVTEPTPFGFHDLKLTIDVLKQINKPFGIVINKATDDNFIVEEYISEHKMDLLAKIPFDKNYASAYATGDILDSNNQMDSYYDAILCKLKVIMKCLTLQK